MSSRTSPTTEVERELLASRRFLLAIDEVGRGAVAGPVAVGVVLIDSEKTNLDAFPPKLRDSKLISEKVRISLVEPIQEWVVDHSVGFSSAQEIDSLGIIKALALAAGRAIGELVDRDNRRRDFATQGAVVLLDGSHNWLAEQAGGLPVVVRTKADRDCAAVAAASVLAKVKRDALMVELDSIYSGFGLAGHKGYAAPEHIQALKTRGPTEIHRLTWLGKILAEG